MPRSQDQPPQTPAPREPRRPSPTAVALVLLGVVAALSIGAYVVVTGWLG